MKGKKKKEKKRKEKKRKEKKRKKKKKKKKKKKRKRKRKRKGLTILSRKARKVIREWTSGMRYASKGLSIHTKAIEKPLR